jgi:hypothetical protein
VRRQARIVRFWMLFSAAGALSVFRPDVAIYLFAFWAWVPLGLFMPAFPRVGNCTRCDDDEAPLLVQVVITGTQDQPFSNPCGNCDELDGTYIMDFTNGTDTLVSCYWCAELPSPLTTCNFNRVAMDFVSDTQLWVTWAVSPANCDDYSGNGGVGGRGWGAPFGFDTAPTNCTTWSGHTGSDATGTQSCQFGVPTITAL